MPSFGKKKCTVEETMAGLEAPLRAFHEASGGDIEAVAALFAAMSGQMLPPQVLCQIMGVTPEQMESAASDSGIRVSAEQLLAGVAAALDEGDSAAMYVDKIAAETVRVAQKAETATLRAAVTFDEATALDIEKRLLASMQADADLGEHLSGLLDLHTKWRQNTPDLADTARFPTVVAGPQVLALEGINAAHTSTVLTEAERQTLFLGPGEPSLELLRCKLSPLRQASPAVVAAMNERIAWLAGKATGVDIKPHVLGDRGCVAEWDVSLACDINSAAFQSQVDATLSAPETLNPEP